jgi:hypothetical protein
MVVQNINSGSDLGQKHFDIQMPGGGFGIFDGCAANGNEPANGAPQYTVPYSAWGARYGGVPTRSGCSALPASLQVGCHFRFDAFLSSDNPGVSYVRVPCPSALTDKSGCKLASG